MMPESPRDAFDDALERMQNATRAARSAFLDADAALTLALQAERDVTREKGSLRETLDRLEQQLLADAADRRDLRATVAELTQEIARLKNGLR